MDFRKAIDVYFPQWDSGSIYINILGLMLYHGSEDKRKSFVMRLSLEQQMISKKERGIVYLPQDYARDFSSLCNYLCEVDKLHSMMFGLQTNSPKNEFTQKIARGMATGSALYMAYLHNVSVQKGFKMMINNCDEYICMVEGKEEGVSYKYFCDKVWKELSPVAHYWAAWAYFNPCKKDHAAWTKSYPDRHFFSSERLAAGKPNGFEGFLLVADQILDWATSFIPPTSTHRMPILKMSKCYYVNHPFSESDGKK